MSNQEYLTQARTLLTEDYKTKHSNEYNSWLARQQHSWMQPHIVVPFPPFVVSAALAPFKASVSAPSEEAVVAKALELYNQFNPAPVVKEEPVVELPPVVEIVEDPVVEVIVEPVVEEIITEPVAELVVEELIVETTSTPSNAIYKIFQEPVAEESVAIPATEIMPPSIEQALNVVPQPAEELAKISSVGRILPTVLERLQAITSTWSTKGEKNV